MGHEILYCSFCSERILGSDLEKGRALKSGHQAACAKCAPEFRKTLPAAAAPEPPPRLGSETRTPALVRKSGSTVRIPTLPASRNGTLPVALGVGGAVLAAIVIVAVLASPARPGPAPAAVQRPETRRPPAPPPPPPAVDTGRVQAAEKAVLAARSATATGDVETAFEAWDAALRASDRTSWNAEAATGYQAAAERRRAAWKASMEEGEKEIRASLERGDATAWKAVVAKLRLRHRGAEWTSKVDDLGSRVERAAADLAAAAKADRPWTPIYDGRTTEFLRAECRSCYAVEGGALVQKSADNAAQTRADFGEGEYRIRFEADQIISGYVAVMQSGQGAYRVVIAGERVRLAEGKDRELLVTVKGGKATASLNGTELPVLTEGSPVKAAVQFNLRAGSFRILSLEYRGT